MKTLLITILFLCSGILSATAQEEETVTLTIEISITKYNKGNILLALYNSEEDYLDNDYRSASVVVTDKKAIIVFKEIDKGTYAFSFFHDVNNNENLDTNFLGIPKEPYGFSNHQKGRFGPPKFEKAMFDIKNDLKLEISIK
jgi:uncharacterized protein (DUF2141 family)